MLDKQEHHQEHDKEPREYKAEDIAKKIITQNKTNKSYTEDYMGKKNSNLTDSMRSRGKGKMGSICKNRIRRTSSWSPVFLEDNSILSITLKKIYIYNNSDTVGANKMIQKIFNSF